MSGAGANGDLGDGSRAVVVFFDIGGTLARPRLGPDGALQSLDVYPAVLDVLAKLRSWEVPLGIISNTGAETAENVNQLLAKADLLQFFDVDLLLYSSVEGIGKDGPEIFTRASSRAGQPSSNCVYVGEDSLERMYAIQAGMQVCPHPDLVFAVLAGESLHYVRVSAPAQDGDDWTTFLNRMPFVPLHRRGVNGTEVIGVASESAIATIANAQFSFQMLGLANAPMESELYLLRDDLATDTGALAREGHAASLAAVGLSDAILGSSPEGIIVAFPPTVSVETAHFEHAAHGHNMKLSPAPGLLAPISELYDMPASLPPLTEDERSTLETITANAIVDKLEPYTGARPLGDSAGTAVASRHIHHADNNRATLQLARDLAAIGGGTFDVSLLPFTHEGRTLHNVEATLTGATDGYVLITAHLDSTAASSRPYDPDTDPAPGADDDGSGLAAVLAAADAINELASRGRPELGIRLVLFNAEEHGLIGSRAYANDAVARTDPIAAVLQLDMIGYNVAAPRSFEIHSGFTPSPEVRARSRVLAGHVENGATNVSPLAISQLYDGEASRDPAEGRSDHTPFQSVGYPACLVSEDFFVGPGTGAPAPEPNPNYHKPSDTFIDAAYAADIARSVVATAWLIANANRSTQGAHTMGMKIASGSTPSGSTNWQQYHNGRGVFVDVDTSACGFKKTPVYVTSLGGRSHHWATTGGTSVYRASPNGFRIYVRYSNSAPLTPSRANSLNWHINWMGVEA